MSSVETPIIDFVRSYGESGFVRAHMPGHKGRGPIGPEALDITEIRGADELYGAEGIIKKSEEIASRLFGTGRTLYSAEGSSLCICAMLLLALQNAKAAEKNGAPARRYTVLAGRNAHKTLMTAAALLDLDIDWLYPVGNAASLLACRTDIRALDDALAVREEKAELPIAVYVTSPDYLGNIENIRDIAAVCHWHGVPLLVDNAHGAYLRFLPKDMHPISLGADMCCDSAHKTLPCLTGAAYLHINRASPAFFAEHAENALSLFASTSPSYLILQSLDAANAYIADGFAGKLAAFAEKLSRIRTALTGHGFELIGAEPLKLTIAPKRFGYTGDALADLLRLGGIECEFSDPDHTVLMLTPENGDEELRRIVSCLLSAERRSPLDVVPPAVPRGERALTVREAVLAPQERIPAELSEGRILGCGHIACPPAVPIVTAGERITAEAIACFRYYGITECTVVGR